MKKRANPNAHTFAKTLTRGLISIQGEKNKYTNVSNCLQNR